MCKPLEVVRMEDNNTANKPTTWRAEVSRFRRLQMGGPGPWTVGLLIAMCYNESWTYRIRSIDSFKQPWGRLCQAPWRTNQMLRRTLLKNSVLLAMKMLSSYEFSQLSINFTRLRAGVVAAQAPARLPLGPPWLPSGAAAVAGPDRLRLPQLLRHRVVDLPP